MQEILSELNEYLIPDVSKIIIYYLSTPIADDIHTLVNPKKSYLGYYNHNPELLVGIIPKKLTLSVSLNNVITYVQYQYKDSVYHVLSPISFNNNLFIKR
jgi:hypothetical protein